MKKRSATILKNVITGEILEFESLTKASKYVGTRISNLVKASKNNGTVSGTDNQVYKPTVSFNDECAYCGKELELEQRVYCSSECSKTKADESKYEQFLTYQRLHEIGASYAEIGRMFNISRQRVRVICETDYSEYKNYEQLKNQVNKRYKRL